MAGLASEGVVVHRLGVVPTPVVAFEAARRGCLGGDDLGVAQPVPGQRHQAVRPRRDEAAATRSRQRIEADVVGAPGADRRPGAAASTSRTARPTSSTCSARSRAAASTASGSSSTPPTARRARSPAPLLRLTGADVVAIHDRARRAQHQRRLRRDRHRVAGRGRRRARRRPRPRPRRRRRPAARRRPHRRARRRRPHHRRLRHRPARPRRCCATAPSS